MKRFLFPALFLIVFGFAICSPLFINAQVGINRFEPLESVWRAPNECRLGSGAPGPDYWQQRADYNIEVRLEEKGPTISGKETITYYNQSPHTLPYLWLQLDQNLRLPNSNKNQTRMATVGFSGEDFSKVYKRQVHFKGGYSELAVLDENGNGLPHRIVETNLRIDLPEPLKPGEQFRFKVSWAYPVNNAAIEGRSGYEYFPGDGNYLFEIAQFYPRMCVYDDINGWQNKPFFGPAEFALEFGNFEVAITAPETYTVSATGDLLNPDKVLTATQRDRLKTARSAEGKPVFIITTEEATANESKKDSGTKTWKYRAENVRDFAFAASRKFAWQAGMVKVADKEILAQALFPKEAVPLWDKYATHTVMHTLRTYSKYSVDYPYSTAIAVHGPVWGMEYPMICFCGGRPNPDGFYSRQTKYNTIGVIIHEVGHNFFPMIVNSDERKWAWMDEGMNSFLEYLTEYEFEPNYPHRRGPAAQFAPFLDTYAHQPVMTNPESLISNGKTSYEKVAVGLKILRDQVMGPKLFDESLRHYSRSWAFHRPTPEDFFRSMEDYSGMDLDWFWRNWFYEALPVDLAVIEVKHFEVEDALDSWKRDPSSTQSETMIRGEVPTQNYYITGKPELRDKYTGIAQASAEDEDEIEVRRLIAEHTGPAAAENSLHVYHIAFANRGGCPMPVPFELMYLDGTREQFRLPAEVWAGNFGVFVKEIACRKEVVAVRVDGGKVLPDVNRGDNFFGVE